MQRVVFKIYAAPLQRRIMSQPQHIIDFMRNNGYEYDTEKGTFTKKKEVFGNIFDEILKGYNNEQADTHNAK